MYNNYSTGITITVSIIIPNTEQKSNTINEFGTVTNNYCENSNTCKYN